MLLQVSCSPYNSNQGWHDIFVDLIAHLSSYNIIILVIVDRFLKHLHCGMLPSSYTTYYVAKLFSTMICRCYGFPNSIVSNRDPIFTTQFWQALFKLNRTLLPMSSFYHPEADAQNEVINRSLRQYFGCSVHNFQTKWGVGTL